MSIAERDLNEIPENSSNELHVSYVPHKAIIEVNEEGNNVNYFAKRSK